MHRKRYILMSGAIMVFWPVVMIGVFRMFGVRIWSPLQADASPLLSSELVLVWFTIDCTYFEPSFEINIEKRHSMYTAGHSWIHRESVVDPKLQIQKIHWVGIQNLFLASCTMTQYNTTRDRRVKPWFYKLIYCVMSCSNCHWDGTHYTCPHRHAPHITKSVIPRLNNNKLLLLNLWCYFSTYLYLFFNRNDEYQAVLQ